MNIIDYTGKLNKHAKYIKVLDILEQKTKYIEVVLIDEKKTNYLVEKFNKDIVSIKTVSEWWGTKTSAKNKLIRIKSSSDLFNYLKQFETFCKYYEYGSNPKSFLRGMIIQSQRVLDMMILPFIMKKMKFYYVQLLMRDIYQSVMN
jgi:hypothetical protein